MKILILGGSGGCGLEVVHQAVARGYQVTAVVREETPFKAPDDVKVVRGSVLNRELLESAVKGKDAVISCLGLNRKNKLNPWSQITSPKDLTSQTVSNLVSILKPEIKLAVISAAGVGESFSNTNPVLKFLIRNSSLGPAYNDLERMEEELSESKLDWYAVRPVTLTDFRSKPVIETNSYGLFDMISRASVACFLLDLVAGNTKPKTNTPLIKD
ncbi:MAG: NAD(P)H-binding protein [Balneola sp.]|jgi:putative NADH-flavin reductase